MTRINHRAFGRRLRVTRIALGISEAEAASAVGCSVRTWQKYEHTGKGKIWQSSRIVRFADLYDVSLDWLISGDGGNVRDHLSRRTTGKIAILPAKGPVHRRARETYARMGIQEGGES